jgi:DNA polymerase I
LKTFSLEVGPDGRNRTILSAFRSKTSRNQPSNSKFAFGVNSAFRSLIKPHEGRALGYLDFSGQEYAIAAYFSGDRNMVAAYESGDPYSFEARMAGEMPADGNKKTHPHVRATYKLAALGTLYLMGVPTLAEYLGVSLVRAKALRKKHVEMFPQFWRWSAAVQDAAIATGVIRTVFGWPMRVLKDCKPGTLGNYPMQGGGADMLRLALIKAMDRDVPIVAPVHDAIVVEGDSWAIDDIVEATRGCMIEASREVLGGPGVRVDASVVKFPDRYIDDREGSQKLWNTTLNLLQKIDGVENKISETAHVA